MTRRALLRSLGFADAASALVGPAVRWATTTNVSRWHLATAGDLTAALASKPNTSVPIR
jgi:hypothetical protein